MMNPYPKFNLKSWIYISLAILLLVGTIQCKPPKKKKGHSGKGKAKASSVESALLEPPNLTKDELILWKIKKMKESEPCFFDFTFLKVVETGEEHSDFLPNFVDKSRKNLLFCRKKYAKVIEDRLDQLGAVGNSLRKWSDVLSTMASERPSEFRNFLTHHNPRKMESPNLFVEPFREMQENLEIVMNLGGPSKLDEDTEKNTKIDWAPSVNALWKAWNTGLGVCIHLKEEPLRTIIIQIQEYAKSVRASKREDYRELYYWITQPDKETKKLPLQGFYSLRMICRSLLVNPSPWRIAQGALTHDQISDDYCRKFVDIILKSFLPGGQRDLFANKKNDEPEEADFESLLKLEKAKLEESSSEQLVEDLDETDLDIKCPYVALVEIKDCFKCLKKFKREDDKQISSLLSAIGSKILKSCLIQYPMDEWFTWLETFESFKRTKEYMNALEKYYFLDHKGYEDLTMMKLFRVRSISYNPIELKFFFQDPVEGLDLENAYKTGADMCEFFRTDVWQASVNADGKLIDIFEIFSEFYRAPKFRLNLRGRFKDFFNLFHIWIVCSQILLIPFGSTS